MVNAESLKLDIIAELNKSGLTKIAKDLENSVDDGIIANLENQLSAINQAIKSAKSISDIKTLRKLRENVEKQLSNVEIASKGGYGGIFKTLISLGGKIFGGITIVAGILKAFQPAIKFAEEIVNMIGEFVRPIADIMVIMLKPILQLLRPVLTIFRTMYEPFKSAMLKLSASGGIDINTGVLEKDNDLLRRGLLKSLLAVELGLSGFLKIIVKGIMTGIKSLTNVLLFITNAILKGITIGFASLAKLLGGKKTSVRIAAIGGTLSGILSSSKENFFEMFDMLADKTFDSWIGSITNRSSKLGVDISDTLFQTLENVSYREIFEQAIVNQTDILSASAGLIVEILSGKLDDALKNYKYGEIFDIFAENVGTGLTESLQEKWDKLVESGDVQSAFTLESIQKAIQTFEENISIESTDIDTNLESISSSIKEFIDDIESYDNEIKKERPNENEITEERVIVTKTTEKKKSWFSLFKENLLSLDIDDVINPFNKIMDDIFDATKKYLGESIIPESFETGLKEIKETTDEKIGNEVPSIFNESLSDMNTVVNTETNNMKATLFSAYQNMTTKTQSFANVLRETSNLISNLIAKISDANARAQRAAKSAERAASIAYSASLRARSV